MLGHKMSHIDTQAATDPSFLMVIAMLIIKPLHDAHRPDGHVLLPEFGSGLERENRVRLQSMGGKDKSGVFNNYSMTISDAFVSGIELGKCYDMLSAARWAIYRLSLLHPST